MALSCPSSPEHTHQGASSSRSNKEGKKPAKRSERDAPPAKKKSRSPASIRRRVFEQSLEEPDMDGFIKAHEETVDESLKTMPHDELLRKYLAYKNDQYQPAHLEGLAHVMGMCMEVDTERYNSLGTFKEYVRTAAKAEVVAFLRKEVLGANSCRQVCDKYVNACYQALYTFATIVA